MNEYMLTRIWFDFSNHFDVSIIANILQSTSESHLLEETNRTPGTDRQRMGGAAGRKAKGDEKQPKKPRHTPHPLLFWTSDARYQMPETKWLVINLI